MAFNPMHMALFVFLSPNLAYKLAPKVISVGLNRAEGDHQRLRDLGVGFALGNQVEHLQLARTEWFNQRRGIAC